MKSKIWTRSDKKIFFFLFIMANIGMVPATWYFREESDWVVIGVVAPLMIAGWLFGYIYQRFLTKDSKR